MWDVVFILVGIVGIVGAVMYWRRVSVWLAKAEATTAEILRLESSVPGHGAVSESTNKRATVFPVVRFVDGDGTTHEYRAAMGGAYGRLKEKREIEIVYDPANPSDVRLGKGADQGFAAMLGLLSLICIAIGVARVIR